MRGRKKKKNSSNETFFHFRLSHDLREKLRELANQHNMTSTAFVKHLIHKELEKIANKGV